MENSVDDGMPDINATYLIDYWVELKVCENEVKIRDVTKLLRDSQIIWNYRRGKVGALVFVVVRYMRFIVMYKFNPANFKVDNPTLSYDQLAVVKKNLAFDWQLFTGVIRREICLHIQKLKNYIKS